MVSTFLAQTDPATFRPTWALAVLAIVNVGGFVVMGRMVFSGKLRLAREVEAEEKRCDEQAKRAEVAETALAEERTRHDLTRALVFDALTRDVMPAVTRATVALESLTKRGAGGD